MELMSGEIAQVWRGAGNVVIVRFPEEDGLEATWVGYTRRGFEAVRRMHLGDHSLFRTSHIQNVGTFRGMRMLDLVRVDAPLP